jgi:hypothetical protein
LNSKTKPQKKPQSKSREQRQSEKQMLVLWALLVNLGEGLGSDLKPKADKPEREALKKAGLITVEIRKRAYWLSVTDRGWRWAEDHLGDALPDRSYAGSFVLASLLKQLQAFMRATNTPLAEILVPRTAGKGGATIANAASAGASPIEYGAVRDLIRSAYLTVTGGEFSKRALLADLRKHLPDVDRTVLDNTLVRMQQHGDATLMQLDNRPDITQADREAAIQIGQEQRHIIWISR